VIAEGQRIPTSQAPSVQGTVTAEPAGLAIPWTLEHETYSQIPVRGRVQTSLYNDSAKAHDYRAYAQFNATKIIYTLPQEKAVKHAFRVAKQEAGLMHYEGRQYVGLVRHLVMALVVLGFAAEKTERLRGEKPGGDGGAGVPGVEPALRSDAEPSPRRSRAGGTVATEKGTTGAARSNVVFNSARNSGSSFSRPSVCSRRPTAAAWRGSARSHCANSRSRVAENPSSRSASQAIATSSMTALDELGVTMTPWFRPEPPRPNRELQRSARNHGRP
jgi:hypothetical protein